MSVSFCQNLPIKQAIQNWSQILECKQVKLFYFFSFAALSGYVMVYEKVVKIEKRISINNFIRAQVL